MAVQPAVVRRLRQLLDLQGEELRRYLRLVDAQQLSTQRREARRLAAQLEAEGALLDRLLALRRSSDGLEGAYRSVLPGGDPLTEASRAEVARLASAMTARNESRRSLLVDVQQRIGRELAELRRHLVRPAAYRTDSPGIVDISR